MNMPSKEAIAAATKILRFRPPDERNDDLKRTASIIQSAIEEAYNKGRNDECDSWVAAEKQSRAAQPQEWATPGHAHDARLKC